MFLDTNFTRTLHINMDIIISIAAMPEVGWNNRSGQFTTFSGANG
jgi:hypothetical protein